MKNRLLTILLAIFTLGLGSTTSTKACNLSSFTLDSMVTSAGPIYTVYTTLCIGFGKTGTTLGADGTTSTFYLALFSSAGTPAMAAALVSFTATYVGPASVGSEPCPPTVPVQRTATGTTAITQPFFGASLGEEYTIRYRSGLGSNIACISSTSCCGNVGTNCRQIILTFTGIYPDSIRAVGIEGAAPFGGCWPNPDMLVDLSVLPVIWGSISGVTDNGGVNLDWSTHQENKAKEYRIMRSSNNSDVFTQIGVVNAAGTSHSLLNYSFFDANPVEGLNLYQVWQVDVDGKVSKSEIITIGYLAPIWISLEEVFPNPGKEMMTLNILSGIDTEANISVWTLQGQNMLEETSSLLTGMNTRNLNVSKLAPGVYFLRVKTVEGVQEKHIIIE